MTFGVGATRRLPSPYVWDTIQAEYDPQTALHVRQVGDTLSTRAPGGDWQTNDNVLGVSSSSDGIIYLDAAHHVTAGGDQLDDPTISFLIDGDHVAAALRMEMQAYLVAGGQLPPGITLRDGDLWANSDARGDLWLNADGTPSSLFVRIAYAPDRTGVQTELLTMVDYHEVQLSSFASWSDVQAAVAHLGRSIDLAAVMSQLALVVTFGDAAVLLPLQRRRMYAIFAVSMALWLALMPATPIVQAQIAEQQRKGYPILQQAETERKERELALRQSGTNPMAARIITHLGLEPPTVLPTLDTSRVADRPFDVTQPPQEQGRYMG